MAQAVFGGGGTHQRTVGGEGKGGSELAGRRAGGVGRIQRRALDLTELRQELEQCIGAGQRPAGVGDEQIAQSGERVAHRHRAADQILLQAVVRDAQQIVLAGELVEPLLHIAGMGIGPAYAAAPDRGELAAHHHQHQGAQKIELRRGGTDPPGVDQREPGAEQHDAADHAQHRAVAQRNEHRAEDGPGKAGPGKQRVGRVDPPRQHKQQHRQDNGLCHCVGRYPEWGDQVSERHSAL